MPGKFDTRKEQAPAEKKWNTVASRWQQLLHQPNTVDKLWELLCQAAEFYKIIIYFKSFT